MSYCIGLLPIGAASLPEAGNKPRAFVGEAQAPMAAQASETDESLLHVRNRFGIGLHAG